MEKRIKQLEEKVAEHEVRIQEQPKERFIPEDSKGKHYGNKESIAKPKSKELAITLDAKEAIEELSKLIKLLKEVEILIDSITSKRIKDLVVFQDTYQ